MTALAWLVPVALGLGGIGLAAFLWSLHTGQFDDLEGAGWRALDDEGAGAGPLSHEPVSPPGAAPGVSRTAVS